MKICAFAYKCALWLSQSNVGITQRNSETVGCGSGLPPGAVALLAIRTRRPPHYAGMRGCAFHGLVPVRGKHPGVQKDVLTKSPCVNLRARIFCYGFLQTGVRPSIVQWIHHVGRLTKYMLPSSANVLEGHLPTACLGVSTETRNCLGVHGFGAGIKQPPHRDLRNADPRTQQHERGEVWPRPLATQPRGSFKFRMQAKAEDRTARRTVQANWP